MKRMFLKLSLLCLALGLMIAACSYHVTAQGLPKGSAEAEAAFRRLETTDQLRKFDASADRLASGRVETQMKSKPSFAKMGEAVESQGDRYAPGDRPLFFGYATEEFSEGESIDIGLIATQAWGSVSLWGRVLRPGTDGEYDGTRAIGYFMPEVGPRRGWVERVGAFDRFDRVYTLSFSSDSETAQGRYVIDIVVLDGSGNLIQQLFINAYYEKTSKFGRGPIYLDRAENAPAGKAGYVLHGVFPVGVPYSLFVGKKRAAFIGRNLYSTDGTTINVPYGMSPVNADERQDVLLHDEFFRTSWTIRNAVAVIGSRE